MACTELRLAGTEPESIVDGRGIRYTVFVQGCPHNCSGCQNPQTHDFSGGYTASIDSLLAEMKENPLLRGVTFSGGEPFAQANALADLAERLKRETTLDLTVYSGWTYEELLKCTKPGVHRLLDLTDYLVDGPYIETQRDLTLHFRGSRNQRVIDMNATRREGHIVLDDLDEETE
ncbi:MULTISPECIES: anaerobic ribonucleoside-triphosphate reductase activating protein [Caproicibacterium]|jgi:anaerobic ribonucleoside-triphosphate reductase activating protein|nr:anaerobic ribonucleoside-triphosphate reductase activating protein [Caproicibacterium lactatifermentans]ARP49451.1 anaerobic ribonucleoside-triphosphate reductase activating protein [Ruminococcaceae bacterium CPB6]MDD4806945.1 anaerobic ribonucleoside-triphosphate reductase activating protein [Oscillospiraceae bacterium]